MYGTVPCVLNGVTGRFYYTHANKKKATQFTGFFENKYRHEHVKIINSYSVSHIVYYRHIYQFIL